MGTVVLDFTLNPVNIVYWLIIGLVIGLLASLIMRGGGYGIVGDIIIGIVGAFIGGFLASLLGFSSNGLLGTLLWGVVGAIILIAILRAVAGGGRFGRRRTL